MSRQKTTNQTFSLPTELSVELHIYIKPRERSRFVSDAIRKELEQKKQILRTSYLMANDDEGQKETTKEWETILGDGSHEW